MRGVNYVAGSLAHRVAKTSNFKPQASGKLQIPSRNRDALGHDRKRFSTRRDTHSHEEFLKLGAWSFSGAWSLEFGVSPHWRFPEAWDLKLEDCFSAHPI